MDDRYTIDTPENIEFAYDIAGIGSRFLAAIIDTLLIVVAEVLVLFTFSTLASTIDTTSDSLVLALAGLLSFAILWGYYIVFELLWGGQSPGKRVIGLRVVRDSGQPVTFAGSALRNLIRIIDFLPGFYGIGVVAMFIDGRSRRLGDLAAGTLVVKERRGVTLESLTLGSTPPAGAALASTQLSLPNLHLLDERDYNLVQEFLRRRQELGREARIRLAHQLASGLQARLGLPPGGDAEGFLQLVAGEYQQLQRS